MYIPSYYTILRGLDLHKLEETTEEQNATVVYLGAKIEYNRMKNTIRISVYNKSENWTFQVVKFPTGQGNTPSSLTSALMTGELARYRAICNNLSSFYEAVTKLCRTLLTRGRDVRKIIKGWKIHLLKYGNFDIRVKLNRKKRWFRMMLLYL